MSETASNPRAALSVPDPTQAQVPAQLWLRSGRPMFGTAIRVYVAFSIIVSALIFVPRGPVLWGMLGAGVLAFVLFPLVIQGLLAPLERRVLAAGRREATPLLQEVRARGLVRRFAPHAWLTLQEGRLHLRRGDGRAAARAFTETLRLSRNADSPALISAQAQALLLAEQPEQARELLVALGRRQALGAGDQLTLGLALLGGKGNGREALAHIQAAQAGLGDLPRVLAALALALHRADQAEAGLVALQQAQDSLGSEPDPFDEALVQRGVKLLRTVQKALDRRERKVQGKRERVEPVARVAEAPSKSGAVDERPVSPAKSARKAKKDERRASRRAAKAEKRTAGPEATVKPNKAAKVAPKGKAAKAIEPHKLKVVTPPAEAVKPVKPVEVAQETGSKPASAAKPVEVVAAKPVEVSAAKPIEVSAAKPVEVSAAKPVEVVAAKPVEVSAAKPIEVSAAKPVEVAAAKPVEVVAATPAQETGSRPVSAVEPAKAQPAAPATPKPPVSGPLQRPEAARAPAPPPGAALFGSVAAKPAGAPAPAFAAPPSGLRLPPRPVASGPGLTPAAGPPVVRAPLPVGGPPVPKVMSTPGSGSVAGPQSLATPVASPIAVSPPMPAVSAPPIAAQAPVAPSLVMPVPVAPSLPAPPQVQAQGLVAPPQIPAQGLVAPVLVPQQGPTPRVGDGPRPALAQVLPDTDDEWDDMLDALEADNTRG